MRVGPALARYDHHSLLESPLQHVTDASAVHAVKQTPPQRHSRTPSQAVTATLMSPSVHSIKSPTFVASRGQREQFGRRNDRRNAASNENVSVQQVLKHPYPEFSGNRNITERSCGKLTNSLYK